MLSILARPGVRATAFISISLQSAFWMHSTVGRDKPTEHYYDLSGALTHIAIAAHAMTTTTWSAKSNPSWWTLVKQNPRVVVMGVLSITWAIRLGSYLYDRCQRLGKDTRFDKLKASHVQWTIPWIFQAFWCFSLQAPLTMVAAATASGISKPWGIMDTLGCGVFLSGLAIEWLADRQKDRFKNSNPNLPMTSGLFKYCVYPNYFGECVIWCGAFLLASPLIVLPSQLGLALMAPVVDIWLLWGVSGIPLLERSSWKKYGKDPKYVEYRAATNQFFPWMPRSLSTTEKEKIRRQLGEGKNQ
jgi:steroid 5-alpha reductase family enzyme